MNGLYTVGDLDMDMDMDLDMVCSGFRGEMGYIGFIYVHFRVIPSGDLRSFCTFSFVYGI
jgi:hypothetical protein